MLRILRQDRMFYKSLISLALPIVMQNLIMTSLGLVDTFMVGLLGEAPLSAVTVANTPIFVIQLLVLGIQSGSSVLISQFWGKGDRDSISRVVGIGFYLAGAISTTFAVVMFFFPHWAMTIFCNDPELQELASKYIHYAGISYVFNGLTGVYTGAHRSIENPKLGLSIFSVSMCINTFLNWVLIFGNLGAPAMGVEGAAIATLVSRVIEFMIMVVYAGINSRLRFDAKAVFAPGMSMVKRFVRYASPVVLNETMWGLGTAIYPTIMGHMENSKEILAAFTVAGNIEKLCTVVVFAVADTAAIIVGREIGKGSSREKVFNVGSALGMVAFLLGLFVGGIMLLLVGKVIEPVVYPIFRLSELAGTYANMILFVTFTILAPRAFNTTNIVGVLRGGGDVNVAMIIDILPLWLVALPMAALCGLVFKVGIFWVVMATVAENLVKFFLGLWRFRSKKWINDVTIKKG